MILSQNIEIELDLTNQLILDSQSKILNNLYNYLLDFCIKQYEEFKAGNISETILMNNYGLRNYMVNVLKEERAFINVIYSKPLKETADRLEKAFKEFFKNNKGYPNFRSWKKKWFSIYYDEPFVGYKIDGDQIKFSCGKDNEGKRIYVYATLKGKLKKEKLKTLRICKKLGKYYINLTYDVANKVKYIDESKWISIDQNHKNFFCAVDYNGNKILFNKTKFIKYTENQIDELKSKRDLKKKFLLKGDKGYTEKYKQHTKQYDKLNDKILKLYEKLREQKKTFLNTVANYLYKNYDLVIIGDYTPNLDTAKYKTMHRSMLNQELIGAFRRTLEVQSNKSGKKLLVKSERNTTSDCYNCGDRVYKDPTVRYVECKKCGKKFLRDLNSAINIGYEEIKLLSGTDFLEEIDLKSFSHSINYTFKGVVVHKLNKECGNSLV